MAQKPSIPKGTRDFSPVEVAKRNYIFDVVKKHFQTFGFQPIETPSFENSDTLMGKYGDEGDRLIFKILNSGRYFHNKVLDLFKGEEQKISEQPFATYKYCKEYGNRKSISEFPLNIQNFISENVNVREVVEFFLSGNQSVEELKILENQLNKIIISQLTNKLSSSLTSEISEKALRYDLTVPFARYVVMHQNEIDFPFKRYQIQPVWRADRPQKGRFREFYQCDADVVGANSLLQEVELIQLYDAVFTDLNLQGVTIKLNNRKILAGIAEVIGAKEMLIDFTVALDKLDKIGEDGVKKEMLEKGIPENAIAKAAPLFQFSGTNKEQLHLLKDLLKVSVNGSKGVDELSFILDTIESLGLTSVALSIDVTLARGLNYYTGAIFEVAAPKNVAMGSIGGGGRYDDLTGIFGLKDVSGVGISFGLDRIYLVLEELGLFPEAIDRSLEVLCVNFGEKEALAGLKLINRLRKSGIKSDLYPSSAKMQKQMKYANNRNVSNVILIGEQELKDNSFVVKNMEKGSQKTYSLNNVEAFIADL